MAVPSFVGVLGRSPEDLPSGRPQVRDRHLKFHEERDNLAPHSTRRWWQLLDAHCPGDRNEQPRIWTLLSLEVWHRELVGRLNSATA